MKLLRETVFSIKPNIEVLEEGDKKTKNYFLSGTYMSTECVNKNNRIYPKNILERELVNFQKLISENRALGELSHPETPNINLPLVSHKITELHFEGNDIVGKAKVLDTPNGKIVKSLIDEGVVLGMSSRGLGSVKEHNTTNIVQDDYRLATIDIVSEPSGQGCWVNGILEGKEWMVIDGVFTEMQFEQTQKKLKSLKSEHVDKVALLILENFLKKIMV